MIKLFTHTDLDGIGCAILAQLAFGEEIDISYCNYDDINESILDYLNTNDDSLSYIYITDISVSEKVAKLLDERGGVYLFDHHPTALELNKYPWCTVTVEDSSGIKTSGTKMFYHWLCTNECFTDELVVNAALEKFAELVRNYDTWRWSELGEDGIICKQVNDLMYLYGRDRFITWCLTQIHGCVFPRLYAADELILSIKQKEIDDYVEAKNKTILTSVLCGRNCGFVFAEKFTSELGNRLCQMHPELDFIAIINMSGTVSYRSIKDDINLGKEIASLFGGGGHPKAAGSQLPNEVHLKVIKEIFKENLLIETNKIFNDFYNDYFKDFAEFQKVTKGILYTEEPDGQIKMNFVSNSDIDVYNSYIVLDTFEYDSNLHIILKSNLF